MLECGTGVAVPIIHTRQSDRIKQCTDIAASNGADISGRIRHSKGRCPHFGNFATQRIGQNGQRIDI